MAFRDLARQLVAELNAYERHQHPAHDDPVACRRDRRHDPWRDVVEAAAAAGRMTLDPRAETDTSDFVVHEPAGGRGWAEITLAYVEEGTAASRWELYAAGEEATAGRGPTP